jgi:HK97 family phage major capsid protein
VNPLDMMKARLAELRAEAQGLLEQRGALVDGAVAEKRGLSSDEQTRHDSFTAAIDKVNGQIPAVEARVAELAEIEQRTKAADSARKDLPTSDAKVTEPDVYARGNRTNSYFRDLARAQVFGDRDAADRLHRHAAQAADAEQRALGNTNTTGGSGGEFAPPAWFVNEYIKPLRPLRPTADLFKSSPVPLGVSSVNLPKILTGTTVALQSTQNSALSQTDLTTGFVSTGFTTIGGKQVVSQQILDQTAINFDEVIAADLAADYVRALDFNVINGAGTGANNNSVVNGLASVTPPGANVLTFTSGAPTAALLYSKAAGLVSSFATNRFAAGTAWLMHPRRWYWLLAQVDSAGRPLVVPDAMLASTSIRATNPIAANSGDPVAVSGAVGMFLGLPVVIDPLLPTSYGTGTNQDRVYLLKADDLWLFETEPRAEVFKETYADTVGVLFRIYGYIGTVLNRQPYSIGYIDGTGLVAPTF